MLLLPACVRSARGGLGRGLFPGRDQVGDEVPTSCPCRRFPDLVPAPLRHAAGEGLHLEDEVRRRPRRITDRSTSTDLQGRPGPGLGASWGPQGMPGAARCASPCTICLGEMCDLFGKFPSLALLGVKGAQVQILSSRLERVVVGGAVPEKSEPAPRPCPGTGGGRRPRPCRRVTSIGLGTEYGPRGVPGRRRPRSSLRGTAGSRTGPRRCSGSRGRWPMPGGRAARSEDGVPAPQSFREGAPGMRQAPIQMVVTALT